MNERVPVVVDPHGRRMAEVFSPTDLVRLHETVDVVWGRDEPMPVGEVRDALRGAIAIVCSGWRYGDIPLEADRLRAIIDVGGGLPATIDYRECFSRGIRVMTAAPGFGPSVAEMALGMALAAGREIVTGDRAMRANEEGWQHAGNVTTFMLRGKPVGMIGFGTIARNLKALLVPFECPISAYDPWLSDGYLRSQGVQAASLEQVMRSSRVIFVLAAPSSENRALLSRQLLEQIQPEAVLVLMSRSHVVDFEALTELVLEGRFKAAIDVFPVEPLAPDHPIRQAPWAILSAHRAGAVKEGLWELGELVVDDLEALAQGLPPQRLQVATPELVSRIPNLASTSKIARSQPRSGARRRR